MKIEPVAGQVYIVKHSSGMIQARFSHVILRRWGNGPARTHYIFTNLSSGRSIELKSTVKIRRLSREFFKELSCVFCGAAIKTCRLPGDRTICKGCQAVNEVPA